MGSRNNGTMRNAKMAKQNSNRDASLFHEDGSTFEECCSLGIIRNCKAQKEKEMPQHVLQGHTWGMLFGILFTVSSVSFYLSFAPSSFLLYLFFRLFDWDFEENGDWNQKFSCAWPILPKQIQKFWFQMSFKTMNQGIPRRYMKTDAELN